MHRIAATFATPARLRIRVYAPSRARQLLPLFATLSAASSLSFYGNVTCFLVIASEHRERGNPLHGARTVAFPFSCLGLLRFARNDGGGVSFSCHCEGTFSFYLSLRGHLCPRQSQPWSTYSRCAFLSAEIAASGFALLAMTVLLIFSRVSCRPVPCVVPLCGRAVVLRFRNRANYSPRSSYCANGLSGAVYPLRLSSLLLSW